MKNLLENKNLTEDIILKKYKVDDITLIKKLNLWGLKVTDINILSQMPQLEIISLSANFISKLEPIKSCTNLEELYLRKNKIEDIKEFDHLRSLQQLRTLWIADNPCCNTPITCLNPELLNNIDHLSLFRLYMINLLPQIQTLDNVEITNQERLRSADLFQENLLNSVDESLLVIPSESETSASRESTLADNKSLTAFKGVSYKDLYHHDKYETQNDPDSESQDDFSEIKSEVTNNHELEVAPTRSLSAVTGAINQLLSMLGRDELEEIRNSIDTRLTLIGEKLEVEIDDLSEV